MSSEISNVIVSTEGLHLSNNIYYGNNSTAELSEYDENAICQDPLLVNAASGGIGRDTLGGYKLQSTSPAISSGLIIADNGGYDFWGNCVNETQTPNIGAYQG